MSRPSLADVAIELFDMAQEQSTAALLNELLRWHRPVITNGELPVCHGCDQTPESTSDPVWPCTTFDLMAASLLHNVTMPQLMRDLTITAAIARQNTRSAIPAFGPPITIHTLAH